MSYVKTINEDGVVSDIMAVALDPTLDATILKNSNLVNGFTQTTAGVNALDAAAGKSLNDSLASLSAVNVYTGSQITFTQYATMYGSSNKVIHYPNLGIAWIHLVFDIGTISSGAWYDIAELPVKIGHVYYADVFIGGLGDVSNNVRRDLHVVGSGDTSLLGIYLWSEESGKRCYIDLCIPTL